VELRSRVVSSISGHAMMFSTPTLQNKYNTLTLGNEANNNILWGTVVKAMIEHKNGMSR